jgi:hypothetical protein
MSMDVNSLVQFLQMLFQLFQTAFQTAFSNPLSGVIIGGFLFVLGRLAKALEAAGILIVIIAVAMLVLQALGLRPPWP